MDKVLEQRSGGNCEVCSSAEELQSYLVESKNESIAVCGTCQGQLSGEEELVENHWRCLNDSMWSEVDAVKVVAYRMLHQLIPFGWSQDLIDMMYLEEDVLTWAKEGIASEDKIVHLDCNGVVLEAGDSVVLIKDLKVKGGGFTAKRGTAVRNITLVHDNAGQIEGKVESQRIVILTEFVKK
jgi:protein PhnA